MTGTEGHERIYWAMLKMIKTSEHAPTTTTLTVGMALIPRIERSQHIKTYLSSIFLPYDISQGFCALLNSLLSTCVLSSYCHNSVYYY